MGGMKFKPTLSGSKFEDYEEFMNEECSEEDEEE